MTANSPLHKRLNNMVKNLDAIECAILIDRILNSCKEIIENEEEVRKQMENHLISPNLYISSMRKVSTLLDK